MCQNLLKSNLTAEKLREMQYIALESALSLGILIRELFPELVNLDLQGVVPKPVLTRLRYAA